VKRWWLVIALLLSLGVNAGILVTLMAHRWGVKQAQKAPAEKPFPLPNGQEGGQPQKIIRLADQLGLEGDLRHRFISLQGSFFAETLRLRTEQAEVQRELRREVASPSPNQARIDSMVQESGRIFLGLQQALVKNVLDSRRLLNPEQDRKFLKILARLRPGNGGLGGGKGQGQQQRRKRRGQDPIPGEPDVRDNRPAGPGPDAQEPPRGTGGEAGAPGFRPRRQGMGPGARWNRRFGGQGNRLGGQRRRQQEQEPQADSDATPP
jgi:hypothetical protein